MALAIKVPRQEAEKVRQELLRKELFDPEYRISSRGRFVFLPVKARPRGYEVVEVDLEKREKKKSFEEVLKEILTPEELSQVKKSFDFVGDIALLEVPPQLEHREKEIAMALLSSVKAVKSVFKKKGRIGGRERVREVEHLAGEKKTETLHRENGIVLRLDVARVYFSPRLSYERQRVERKVVEGEVIVDLFAGVGPFSIFFARNKDVKVYALDLNPWAIEYLKKNIEMNPLKGEVIPLLGDAEKAAPRGVAHRVIMNLPREGEKYLPLALEVLGEKGTIHFYTIEGEEELFRRGKELAQELARERGRSLEVEEARVVKSYSPRHYHVAYDLKIN